jgi:IMP dehydrogenase
MAKAKILFEESQVYDEFLIQPTLQKKPSKDGIDLSAPISKFHYDESKPWNEQTPHRLKLGLMSAPMQAVSGPKICKALAAYGGIGTVFCSQEIDEEAQMIRETKRSKGGFVEPDVVTPQMRIAKVLELMKKTGHDKYPVTDNGKPNGELVGLLTEDLFDESHASLTVKDRMIGHNGDGWKSDKLSRYVATEREVDGSLEKANYLMRERARSRILLIVDKDFRLKSAVFRRDIDMHKKHKEAELVDSEKRYKVAAAVNTHDYKDRIPAVLAAGADYLVIDSSQGHTQWQAETLEWLRSNRKLQRKFGYRPVISGNYVTPEGFDFAVANGADAVKIGIGPGSICTTRVRYAGGAGQATAIMRIARRRDEYFEATGIYIPLIADGGASTIPHFMNAWALEADLVMCGQYFAGFHESPTSVETIPIESKDGKVFMVPAKPYWGEGSDRAKRWRKNRYNQDDAEEGVEGYVPYKGRFDDTFPLDLRDLKAGVHKWGYEGIRDLNVNGQLMHQGEGSVREGKPSVYRKK